MNEREIYVDIGVDYTGGCALESTHTKSHSANDLRSGKHAQVGIGGQPAWYCSR